MDFEGSPHQVNSIFESGGEHREDTYTGHVFEFRLHGKTIDFHQVSPEVDVYKVQACQLAQGQCSAGSVDGCVADDDDSHAGWDANRGKDMSPGQKIDIAKSKVQAAVAAHEAAKAAGGRPLLWAYSHVSPGFGDGIRWHYDLIGLALKMNRTLVLPPLQMDRPDMSSVAEIDPYVLNETTKDWSAVRPRSYRSRLVRSARDSPQSRA